MSEPSYPVLQDLSAALSGLVEKVSSRVVAVRSPRFASSGFVWRKDLIITADEALTDEGEIAVTPPHGEPRTAIVVGRDPSTDVALLRIEGSELSPIPLERALPKTGSLVLVVGASGATPTAALGITGLVGPAWQSLRGGHIDSLVELAVPLRRQAEGGVVVDSGGRTLGMAVFGPRRRVLMIPATTIERAATMLEQHGRIPRGYIGLGLQPVQVDGADDGGAMVMSIDAGGPGAAAGFRQGDVLVGWNGEPQPSVRALLRTLGPDSVGRSVKVAVRRGGEPLDLTLTIGEKSAA
jgi:S1-C subfamily serine protease